MKELLLINGSILFLLSIAVLTVNAITGYTPWPGRSIEYSNTARIIQGLLAFGLSQGGLYAIVKFMS